MISKIVTQEEKDKKEKRMKVFFAVFMVSVFVMSTFGIALSSSDSKNKKYEGITFYLTENGWQGKNLEFYTNFLPQDVEDIPLTGMLSTESLLNKLYVVSDPSKSISSSWYELTRVIPVGNPNPSCLPEDADEEGCLELPLKNCSDADYQNAVLIFRYGNETSIGAYGSCLEIVGEDEVSMVKAIDKVIFVTYGIIKP
ncbi:hypothetical protein ACFLZZ_03040 [Nanoarchaeota archaeon]